MSRRMCKAKPLEDKITVKTGVMDRGGALIGIQWGRLLATCSLFFSPDSARINDKARCFSLKVNDGTRHLRGTPQSLLGENLVLVPLAKR